MTIDFDWKILADSRPDPTRLVILKRPNLRRNTYFFGKYNGELFMFKAGNIDYIIDESHLPNATKVKHYEFKGVDLRTRALQKGAREYQHINEDEAFHTCWDYYLEEWPLPDLNQNANEFFYE